MRKKRNIQTIKIMDRDAVLYDGDLMGLPIKDDMVIQGSIEYYNDPEPCMIHKSAVISRYYMDIAKWLDGTALQDNEVSVANIPSGLRQLMDI